MAGYERQNGEKMTKAACSKYHADDLIEEMHKQGHELTFKPLPRQAVPDWIKA